MNTYTVIILLLVVAKNVTHKCFFLKMRPVLFTDRTICIIFKMNKINCNLRNQLQFHFFKTFAM